MEEFKKNKLGLPYHRFPAVDGSKIKPTEQLQRIFDGNDYNMRQGMVGCAMSHIKLCIDLINSDDDFFLILEDDIEVTPDFTKKFVHVLKQLDTEWDLVYLGHHLWPHHRKPEYYDKEKLPVLERWSRSKSLKMSMGGTGGYIISRKGAHKLLDFINRTGMTNGIDTVQQKAADELEIYYCTPHLIFSECWTGNNNPDTDIQFCYDSLTTPVDKRFQEELMFYAPDNVQVSMSAQHMETLMNTSKTPVLYSSDDSQEILKLKEKCQHPCYTLNDRALVVVPNPTERHINGRYFDRLKKNGAWDVSDALQY